MNGIPYNSLHEEKRREELERDFTAAISCVKFTYPLNVLELILNIRANRLSPMHPVATEDLGR
jgi:hypothetical protein